MFKKDLWKYLLLDLSFLSGMFFLLVYAKLKLESFFVVFEGYQTQLQAIEPELANQTLTGILEFEIIMDQVNALVTNTYIFVVFLIPLVLYVLFCLTQSYTFAIILNKKYDVKYFIRFLLYGVPFLVLLFFLFNYFFESFSTFLYSSSSFILMAVLFLLILIVFFIWFYVVKYVFKFKGFLLHLKKSVVSYFIMVLFALIVLIILGILYVRFLTDSFYGMMWLPTILALVLFLVLAEFFRVKFLKRL